jgi:hypothetical protein
MKRVVAIAFVSAVVFALSGCAMYGGSTVEQDAPGVQKASGPSPAAAQAMVHAGSTKADVVAALGRGNGVAFDSGWEVWVYRWLGADHSARGATELVILFGPDGTVRKTRLRAGAAGG